MESFNCDSNLSRLAKQCDTEGRSMSVRFKGSLAFIVGAAAVVSVVCTLLLLLWLREVQNDRQHTVSVNRATPLFVGSGRNGGCHGVQLTMIQQGAKLPVRRITYLKDCVAIDVALPNGRDAYVVLGTGDVSVNPPLPTI